jgi:lipoteichoic acid synthase
LLNRVLQRVEENRGKRFFMFVVTVSSHHPYQSPETGHRSEEEVFRYVDAQIGKFYDRLVKTDFFDDGLLILVGDHHAMIPLKREEVERYGAATAPARIPLIVSDGGHTHYLDRAEYQQTDVFNSLRGMVSGRRCRSDWMGDVLTRDPPKFLLFRRGGRRNVISVFSAADSYSIRLDGDDTRVVDGPVADEALRGEIVAKVNALRIAHQRRILQATR